jgi:DNA polymerase-4
VTVKTAARQRSILHVDLDPFFVAVERSLDPLLRGRAVVVGGQIGAAGLVAAASGEARQAGVAPGQSVTVARRLCPDAVFRPGDLEAYARASEEVTAVLLSASRRVERPSADEAYVDLSAEPPHSPSPSSVAETIKDELQRRLGLDASLGLAGSRLAARVASARARPRGLLIVLPGYDASFLARQPLTTLPDLPSHLERALLDAGFEALGDVADSDPELLAGVVGKTAAQRLADAARGLGEPPIALLAPPAWIQEEAVVRDRASDEAALLALLQGLALRACRRLRPYGLLAGTIGVEIVKARSSERRSENVEPAIGDEETIARVAAALAAPLLEAPAYVRALQLRLGRLARATRQAPLFPQRPDPAERRRRLLQSPL